MIKYFSIFLIAMLPTVALGYEPEGFISTNVEDIIKFPSAVFIGRDDPDQCIEEIKFAVYGDNSLSKLCYCNGSLWCPEDGGACGTSASCG